MNKQERKLILALTRSIVRLSDSVSYLTEVSQISSDEKKGMQEKVKSAMHDVEEAVDLMQEAWGRDDKS